MAENKSMRQLKAERAEIDGRLAARQARMATYWRVILTYKNDTRTSTYDSQKKAFRYAAICLGWQSCTIESYELEVKRLD